MRKKFTDCVDIVGSSCENFEGTKFYISTGAVDEDDINEYGIEVINFEEKPSRANLVVKSDDIIFAKMQATKKTLLINEEFAEYVYSTGFCAVHAKKNILTRDCLLYLLMSEAFLNQKDKNCSGATQKAITNAGLQKIIVNIPDYKLQDDISKRLSILLKVINMRKNELDMLDNLIKARFVEMFGEPRSNPFGFEKMILKDTCKIITGNTPSRAVDEYYGEFIEWIKTDNIVSGLLYPTKATEGLSEKGVKIGRTVDKDSILMACIAGSIASIGRVCITDRRVAFNQQINAIIPQKYNIHFLYVLLQISKDYLVEDINMALKGILSKSKLEEKEFVVPPKKLQEQFADFVHKVDKSKVVYMYILKTRKYLMYNSEYREKVNCI